MDSEGSSRCVPAGESASRHAESDDGRRSGVKRELFDLMRRFGHDRYDIRPFLADGMGMTAAEAHMLAYLLRAEREGGAVRPSDIAHRVRITPSAISQTLKALERKGMVARERSASDSRSVTLHLTGEGRSLASELCRRRSAMTDDLIAYIGEDDLRAFVSTLGKIMEFCDGRSGRGCGDGGGRRLDKALSSRIHADEGGKAGSSCA